MNISIQTLKAFKTAAETKNFTRAAEQMYMTQPAFSRLISSLENELGVRLFTRTTRKIQLTPAGEVCYLRVNQILEGYSLLMSDVERIRHSYTGQLNVGFNPLSGPPEFLIRALKQLGEEYPGIKVTLVRAYSSDLVSRVKNGELDCALVSEHYITTAAPLITKRLQFIKLYALLHTSHPLAKEPLLTISQLSDFSLIFMKDSAPLTRKAFLTQAERLGIPLVEDTPAYDLEDLIMRVRIGNEVGITSFCDPNEQYGDITSKSIQELRGNSYRVLAWHRDCKNPSLRVLISVLDQELSQNESTQNPLIFD